MITSYVRPQDTITQILQQTADREASRTNPIVIGPQFDLYLNDGRDLSAAKLDFAVAGASGLEYLDENGTAIDLLLRTPETGSAELYGDDLEAAVAAFGGGLWTIDAADTAKRTIILGTDTLAGAGTLNATLDGRQIAVGDRISLDWDDGGSESGTSRRTVVGLSGVVTPAVAPANASALGPYNAVTLATQALEAATGTDGVWTVDSVDVDTDIAVFQANGLTLEESGGDLQLGDQITVVVTLAGASGVATVDVTSLANGLTDTAVLTVDPGAGEYEVDLSGVGYASSTLTLTHSGTAAVGETAVINVFPAYTQTPTTDLTVAGTYTGPIDRRYAVEVLEVTGGSTVDIRVTDLAGDDPAVTYNDIVVLGASAIGTSGCTVALAADTYYKGEIFYIDLVAAITSTTEFDRLILDGPPIPTSILAAAGGSETIDALSVFQVFNGVLNSDNLTGMIGDALTANAADWEYAAALGLNRDASGRDSVSLSPFADGYGQICLSYKALVIPSATESMIELESEDEITTELGESGLANWLSRGALEALRGNQNQVVYALRTGGDTVADFTTALRKIQTTDQVYALVGLTDDEEVMELIRDHCLTQSNKYNKNFRRAYVGTDSPGEYEHWGELPGGGYRTGDLLSSVVTLNVAFRAEHSFVAADVGSTIRVQSLGLDAEILEVLSDFEVLTDADDALTATASGLEITRSDTPANNALFVSARSQNLSSRRISNVWCDNPTITVNGVTTVVPMKFVAAEIAGLRCALLPQQGLTMTEIESVDAAPSMYTTFDPSELDDVSANGTFVVTQESEGGEVFIRHQLTTETEEGALAYEDNVGVIVDDFSFAVKDNFREYIGRRNATPDTISEIDDKLRALASDYTEVPLVNEKIGAPILAFFDEKGNEGQVTVRQDGDLADTLLTYVLLQVPLPLNGINHYVDVEVSELLASEDN